MNNAVNHEIYLKKKKMEKELIFRPIHDENENLIAIIVYGFDIISATDILNSFHVQGGSYNKESITNVLQKYNVSYMSEIGKYFHTNTMEGEFIIFSNFQYSELEGKTLNDNQSKIKLNETSQLLGNRGLKDEKFKTLLNSFKDYFSNQNNWKITINEPIILQLNNIIMKEIYLEISIQINNINY
jgi:hypothetical protein